MTGALEGLRLIEMGQLIAGPFCGQLMADHGAEVIKIEPPGVGDPMRLWGQGKPLWWSVVARNKKCITLNLREREGQEIVRKLVERSDFLLENFRPGTMEKWHLGYDELMQVNPKIIMIRVSGFGQTGPYAKRAGYGSIGEAMGGMRYLAGDPSTPPSRIGISIGDSLAATYACLGALLALHHRDRTGRGQVVDSAIYEAVLAMMESTVAEWTEAGVVRERTGSILPGVAPSNVYPTKDGEILIGANQDSVWKRMAAAMERPELSQDTRFATHTSRGSNQAELDNLISEWTETFETEAILSLLEEYGVPAGKIFTAPDMLSDPQYQSRETLEKIEHPQFRNLVMQAPAPRLSDSPGRIQWPGPPDLGAHNEEIYGELLGMSTRKLSELRDQGVI